MSVRCARWEQDGLGRCGHALRLRAALGRTKRSRSIPWIVPVAPAVQIEIYLDGNITPPLEVDLASPSLANVVVELFGGHHVWQATFPPTDSGSLANLSLQISSAKAVESASRSNTPGWTDYIIEGKGSATTAAGQPGVGPGTVTVSLELSASQLAGSNAGSGTRGATNGTCAELTACFNAIVSKSTAATCTALASLYQNMVGAGLSQEQADFECDQSLHLERGAALCP